MLEDPRLKLQPQQVGVIVTTSAITYKDTPKTVAEIGRELHVNYLVEGSVRSDRERVRVNARLVKVSDETEVWSESFEQPLAQFMDLRNNLTWRIGRADPEARAHPVGNTGAALHRERRCLRLLPQGPLLPEVVRAIGEVLDGNARRSQPGVCVGSVAMLKDSGILRRNGLRRLQRNRP